MLTHTITNLSLKGTGHVTRGAGGPLVVGLISQVHKSDQIIDMSDWHTSFFDVSVRLLAICWASTKIHNLFLKLYWIKMSQESSKKRKISSENGTDPAGTLFHIVYNYNL